MERKEFERVWPEEVGISSDSVMRLLDRLEERKVEPHGLMIMRDGKICAEGWWSPYAPGLRHGQQSQSKTYAATAIGLAYTEGLLDLDEKIIDILGDKAPQDASDNLKKMTVHHVLCMACGMDREPDPTEDWINGFLSVEVAHEPGSAFMYNSTASAILVAVLERKTGIGLREYLKTRLFDKIGIDDDHIDWICMPDGTPFGGGGIFSTVEDNLRLMKLYADSGVWEGERLLAEDFVKRATSQQIATGWENLSSDPEAKADPFGYGYQMWVQEKRGIYRATGALGQYTIVDPRRNIILAYTGNEIICNSDGPAQLMKMFWSFLDEIEISEHPLPLPPSDCAAHLAERLSRLSLPNPIYRPYSRLSSEVNEQIYKIQDDNLYFSFYNMIARMAGMKKPTPIEKLQFSFVGDSCMIQGRDRDGIEQTIRCDMKGGYHENTVGDAIASRVLAAAHWESPDTLCVTMRWIETAETVVYRFTFRGDALTISFVPAYDLAGQPITAEATREEI